MGISRAIAPRPKILKISNPTILAPPARGAAQAFATRSAAITVPAAGSTASRGLPALSQMTMHPNAAAATASSAPLILSQRTMHPNAATASAVASGHREVRVISPARNATASRTPPSRAEKVPPAAIATAGAPGHVTFFKGDNENPLDEGGLWSPLDTAFPRPELQRKSNTARAVGTTDAYAFSVYDGLAAMTDMEVSAKISTIPAASREALVMARLKDIGSGTWDGYAAIAQGVSSLRIYRFTNGAATLLASPSQSHVAGMWLKIRCIGTTIELWRKASDTAEWTFITSVVDATHASGKAGLGALGTDTNGPAFSAFAAGPITVPRIMVTVPAPGRDATAARTPPVIVIS